MFGHAFMEIKKEYSLDIGGETLTATFTDMTDQAHGSVIMRYGNSAVLATAVMSDSQREGLNYFPLSVEYEEKFYAAGRILGSRFTRREGRPSDEAVLSGRMVDRTIRPLFDHGIRNDVQVVITILAIDEHDPDVLAINAASLALGTSDIPWGGPVSAVRLGREKGDTNWTVNPTYELRNGSCAADVLACGKDGLINMIEVGAHEISEDDMAGSLREATEHIEKIQAWQESIIKDIGNEKRDVEKAETSEDVQKLFEKEFQGDLMNRVFAGKPGKEALKKIAKDWKALVTEKLPEENISLAMDYLDHKIDEAIHEGALKNEERADGRGLHDVRPISAKAGGISDMIHGSGVFYRGGTHVFSALTLGGPQDSLLIESMEEDTKKRFMHHYNFPPFSVGETGRVGGFNRRMIGHGALAEKALRAVIPPVEDFPYTIRIVSEALASNGSTSMGSVCGSTIALMDAGVPITAPVAGIAMGLMSDENGSYKILTDIQGPEDHHGDMDFKVAGTRNGITAIQMDVKVAGISIDILTEALGHARDARLHILDVIEKEISEPRKELSSRAPRILTTHVKEDQIGLVIGSGGKTVTAIRDATGAEIDIEDDGTVYITGEVDGATQAQRIIESITKEYTAGERTEGEVIKITDFGAFVRLGDTVSIKDVPSNEGLVHISEIAPFRIANVTDVLQVGETVPVIVKEIDDRGRIGLSIKDADKEFAEKKGVKPASKPAHNGTKRDTNKRKQ